MEKLKLCPFCGGKALLIKKDKNAPDNYPVWDIECKTEGCYLFCGADWWCYKKEAIYMWNMRDKN